MNALLASAAFVGIIAGTAACAPPPAVTPVVAPARCAVSPTSGRYFGTTSGLRCDPTGAPYIIVNIPCGPLLATHAEDDVCVAFVRQGGGAAVVGPLSAMVPGDIRTGTYL